MTIVRQHRQTIIDHDPATGAVVGATKIFQRFVEEDGKHMGFLPSENEDLPVKDVPTIWGDTTDEQSAKLRETADILQTERDSTADTVKFRDARIAELEDLLETTSKEADRMKAIIQAAQRTINSF